MYYHWIIMSMGKLYLNWNFIDQSDNYCNSTAWTQYLPSAILVIPIYLFKSAHWVHTFVDPFVIWRILSLLRRSAEVHFSWWTAALVLRGVVGGQWTCKVDVTTSVCSVFIVCTHVIICKSKHLQLSSQIQQLLQLLYVYVQNDFNFNIISHV